MRPAPGMMGLPTPGLFTGRHIVHPWPEWISAQDEEKCAAVVLERIKVREEKA